jgi:transcriptional repressor NrdR
MVCVSNRPVGGGLEDAYARGSDCAESLRVRWGPMNCPFCSSPDSRVVDSRETDIKEAIRRRRECIACGQRFTTYEKIEEIPITVVKRDGGTELFHPEKLLHGLTRACTKRHVPVERLQSIVCDIERELREESAYEVPSERVGNMALERLQQVDLVAYVRFASVYRQFESVEEFRQELQQLAKEGIR